MMSRAHGVSPSWSLAAGESRLIYAAAGTQWTATRGVLQLAEPPQWLGERMLSRGVMLRDGESHVVDSSGWVTLQALSDACVHHQAPPGRVARWFRSGRAWRVPAASF